jgi:mevalonate kinase
MQKYIYSAPGKIHLLGEHAVVYGKPAIIAALDLRSRVEIIPTRDDQIEITWQNVSRKYSIDEVIKKTKEANINWDKYIETGDSDFLKKATSGEQAVLIIAIGEVFNFYKVRPAKGFKFIHNTEIPIGCGMGSSAAFAVTASAAVSEFLGKPFDREKINEIAFVVEQKCHGNPSGGDNSTSCYGGLVWFRKESDNLKIIKPVPFSLEKSISNNFLFINSGKPEESTGEMVAKVRTLSKKKPKLVENFLEDQEETVRSLLTALKNSDPAQIIKLIKRGEVNLEKIGVVSDFSKQIIRKIEKAGGAAKICGGGGVKGGTGIILAYHNNMSMLKKKVGTLNLDSYMVKLGSEGVTKL